MLSYVDLNGNLAAVLISQVLNAVHDLIVLYLKR